MLKIEKISSNIDVKEERSSPFKSRYILEPLYRGYGNTVGNALRRVLLSSMPGAAIKGVKIESVLNEFSTMEGVKESVVDILLNIKSVVLKSDTYGDRTLKISVQGPQVVTAADIGGDDTLEVVNKDKVIATITGKIKFEAEFIVGTGEGFVTAEEVERSSWPVGFLSVDALYSPVIAVSYSVEDTMVGRVTNYDKLMLDLETDGSVEAKDIMSYAVELLTHHLSPILNIGNRVEHLRGEDEVIEEVVEENSDLPIIELGDLDLSVRSYNCLKKSGIENLRSLAKLTHKDLLAIKNLGKSSLTEIMDKLTEYNIEVK